MVNITNLISPEDEVGGLSFLARDASWLLVQQTPLRTLGHVEAIELINHSTKLTTKYL
jgi:hypothetical protein